MELHATKTNLNNLHTNHFTPCVYNSCTQSLSSNCLTGTVVREEPRLEEIRDITYYLPYIAIPAFLAVAGIGWWISMRKGYGLG